MSDSHEIHPAPTSFLRLHVFSEDHKVIAKQFIAFGMFFLLIGGALAMVMRWQLAHPGEPIPLVGGWLFRDSGGMVTPASYTSLFTLHGSIMIFFAITPILIGGFGNFCIPLLIGARDMVFPKLNMFSFWTQVIAGILMIASFFTPGGSASSGWTMYPPLSTGIAGWGQTLWVLAIFVGGASTIMGAVNYITTVIRLRAPGMGYFKMPLTVWGLWLTAILNALFVPIIASGLLLLTFDRMFGTHFFVAGSYVKGGGDPLLFQHLFWIFGHPEVYILILPVWGIVSDLLAFFARKPAFGYRRTALAMVAVTVLSGVVYGHHMFTTSMSPLLGQAFMVLTMIISVPATILFFNWLGTIWRGSLHLEVPMLFSLGVVFVFGLGGLTGLYLADIPQDLYLHDSYFVVGHFHLTMAAAVLLGSYGAIYFWFPKMTGKMMSSALGKLHFWVSVVPIVIVFGCMMYLGVAGMQRRLYDPSVYESFRHLAPVNHFITSIAFVLGAGQLIFVWNLVYSLVRGEVATQNPWKVGTLEWTCTSSPPPHHNYDEIPLVLNGPHELSHPALVGKDWLGQAEALPQTTPVATPPRMEAASPPDTPADAPHAS